MAWYWWVLIISAGIFLILRRRGRSGEMDGKDASLLNPWFRSEGVEPGSVTYSSYDDANILAHGADRIYVGLGYRDGEAVGFYAELAGEDILEARTIQPGAASYHSTDARTAKYDGATLKGKLTERSLKITMNMDA